MTNKKRNNTIIGDVLEEQNQGFKTRQRILQKVEQSLNRPLLTYFTSFISPVGVDDSDVDMLADILQTMDLRNGLAVMISSPGGDGLTAERIVNLFRTHSKTGEYWAIVPGKAKSAATMICLGSSKIIMGPSAELGPIDPQLTIEEDGNRKRFSVWNLITSYESLFSKAVESNGNLQPFLQQLVRYDEREIQEYRGAMELAEDIAVRSLQSGMMKGEDKDTIKEKINIFLTPKQTKSHGRPIYAPDATSCGLFIEERNSSDSGWSDLFELYLRTNNITKKMASKIIENAHDSFSVPLIMGG